jgi:hypothetical protein
MRVSYAWLVLSVFVSTYIDFKALRYLRKGKAETAAEERQNDSKDKATAKTRDSKDKSDSRSSASGEG